MPYSISGLVDETGSEGDSKLQQLARFTLLQLIDLAAFPVVRHLVRFLPEVMRATCIHPDLASPQAGEMRDRFAVPTARIVLSACRRRAKKEEKIMGCHIGDLSKRWPNEGIPFEINPNVGVPQKSTILAAVAAWNTLTFPPFVQRERQNDYVEFVSGNKCESLVGRQGGKQNVSCVTNGDIKTFLHEMGHAAGLVHEQSRSDRDCFVGVNWENIIPSERYNFAIVRDSVNVLGYDYASIMHYGRNDFAFDPTEPTLFFPRTAPAPARLFSPGDLATLASFYSNTRFILEAVFQADTGSLWAIGSDYRGDMQLGMMAGTSPSITALPEGDWELAFQANTGSLWVVGSDYRGDMQLGMMAGTSPSITALPGGGWQAAFQANTGNLWVVGSDYRGDMKLGMMAGTSPSITALPGGGWEVAFQANTGSLWVVGSDYRGDMKLGMMAGTSPSITALSGGGWEVAFQANTGSLWAVGSDYRGDMQLGMMTGTSPSIAALPGGGWELAFQANTGNLWVVGSDYRGDTKLGMMAGTSPSVAALPGGGWQAAFQAYNRNLWIVVSKDAHVDWQLGMMAGTSPAIAQLRT
ncbi:M12 family metallopeptidase [Burkholderia ubonensis]|uniref:M12 family metallopeptidase n=1 Tax=Burkholderia ubonensis TaxID=101571 RepID=UPI0009B3D7BF|nr:M12 family metallopeptidase [Burkholderia ubonensis]